MAKYSINRGSTANDGTGDNLRAGADKVNLNFDEIYLAIGDGTTLGANIKVKDDSSTVGTINTKGETLGILGGTGITSTISGSDVTLAVDATVVTASSTTTLTNKTLTSPYINEIIFEGATADDYETTIDVVDPTADRTVTLPDISGEVIVGKNAGTNFTRGLIVGSITTGTLVSATDNTGVGTNVFKVLTSGDQNTAIGVDALQGLGAGSSNTALGANTLKNNSVGGSNTAVGYQAMEACAGGNSSTAVGSQALKLALASYNTGVGVKAGEGMIGQDSHNNLVLGYQSGDNITSGAGNVIVGSVDADSATGDRQLKIAGYDGTTTTTWIKGDSAGKVTIPGDLDVQGTQTTIDSATIQITNSFTFEGTTSDDKETILTVIDPTLDRTVSLPDATGTVSLIGNTETLTNKTLTSPILGGTTTSASGNIVIKPASNILEVQGDGSSVDAQLFLRCSDNSHGQTLQAQPHSESATNTMLLPKGANSTLVSLVSTDTLTNKTISNGTISGTTSIDVTSSGNKIRTNFAGTGAFPDETTYEGMFAYDTTGDAPYVADTSGWTKILTENMSVGTLSDVNITGIADSYGLVWSSAQGRFNAAAIPTAGFSIAMAVAL